MVDNTINGLTGAGINKPQSGNRRVDNDGNSQQNATPSGSTSLNTNNSDQVSISFLNDSITRFQERFAQIDRAIGFLRDTNEQLDQISTNIEEIGGLAIQARRVFEADQNGQTQQFRDRFAQIINDIAQNISDAPRLNSKSLFETGPITVIESDRGRGLVLNGEDLSLNSLGFTADRSLDSVSNTDQIQLTATNALDQIRVLKRGFENDFAEIQTRQDLSKSTVDILNTAQSNANNVTPLNEQAAALLALQVKSGLGSSNESLALDGQRSLLENF